MPQTLDEKLDVLGSFAAADGIRSVWGAKLLVNRETGDMQLQQAGFATFWSRRADDSLTNAAVYNKVTQVFDQAVAGVQNRRNAAAGSESELTRRTLYAFKGFSTLVRRGYGGNAVLEAKVTAIGKTVGKVCVPIPCQTHFDQSFHIPPECRGMCYGFTVDWLRRCYKHKYGYGYGLIDTHAGEMSELALKKGGAKLRAIAGIQYNQNEIENNGSRPFDRRKRTDFWDLPIVSNRLSTRAGETAEAAYASRFAGMTLHQRRHIFLPEEDWRCCGVGPAVNAPSEISVGVETSMLYIEQDYLTHANNGPCGWLIGLDFYDFFNGVMVNGHAIGMFFERRGLCHCFDPNHGTVSAGQDFAWNWLQFTILRWSLRQCIKSITINRVSTRP